MVKNPNHRKVARNSWNYSEKLTQKQKSDSATEPDFYF